MSFRSCLPLSPRAEIIFKELIAEKHASVTFPPVYAIFTPHNRHKVSLVIHKLLSRSFCKLGYGFFRYLNREFYDYIHPFHAPLTH